MTFRCGASPGNMGSSCWRTYMVGTAGNTPCCTLLGKAFRSGFYWPTALNDATEMVCSCEACQFHAKQIHQPPQGL